eukprot:CAMPEP_0178937168 /NCGR_PEP_ID=MMETSP0786-20121207/25599_1 /TAXON_ID=186022 /ORGANISM="Thalassionema frauenfeldii, Strain CCMP 1798" /LENGTH=747 /DNA_ID=CAMNT_0020615693 /DNA_START=145 /DNA_END=2388 /DNA_ORIENTATION=+
MNGLMGTSDKQKSDADSVSIDSDHSSDDEASTFLVGSLAQLHDAPSTESFDSKLDHGMKLDINDVSSGALAMHHLYFATMALAYARRREIHKGSMNEVHSCNIERLCDELNSIENRPYPASIWKIWLSMKAEQENSPLLCDVVIDSIQQDLSDSAYIYMVCHAPKLDLVTVVLSTKPGCNLGRRKTYYNFDSRLAVGIDSTWSGIIGEDGSLIVEILSEVKRHTFSHLSFVGHGGGGALAAICSVWACRHRLSKTVKVFSFGCPPIGDTHFEIVHNMLQNKASLQHLRFVNSGDNAAQKTRYFSLSSKCRAVGTLVILKGRKARHVHQLNAYWDGLKNWEIEMPMIEFCKQAQKSIMKPRWIRHILLLTCIIMAIYLPLIYLTLSHPLRHSKLARFLTIVDPKTREILKDPESKTSALNKQRSTYEYNHVPENIEKYSALDQEVESHKRTDSTQIKIDAVQENENCISPVNDSKSKELDKPDPKNLQDTLQEKSDIAEQTQSNEKFALDLHAESKETKHIPCTKGEGETGCENDKSSKSVLGNTCIGKDVICRKQSRGHATLDSTTTEKGKYLHDAVLREDQAQIIHDTSDKISKVNNKMTTMHESIVLSQILANHDASIINNQRRITGENTKRLNMGFVSGTKEVQNNSQEQSDNTELLDDQTSYSNSPHFPGFYTSRSFRRRPSLAQASSLEYCPRYLYQYEYTSVDFVFDKWKRNAWYKKNILDEQLIEAEVSNRITEVYSKEK